MGTAVVSTPIAEHSFRSQCPSGNNLMVLTDRIGEPRVQVAGSLTSATRTMSNETSITRLAGGTSICEPSGRCQRPGVAG
jgi:hypothetical protein